MIPTIIKIAIGFFPDACCGGVTGGGVAAGGGMDGGGATGGELAGGGIDDVGAGG